MPLVALGSLALIGLGPTMSPLQPFNMDPYHVRHFDFAAQKGWPTFPPLLPPNDTLSTRGPWFVDGSGRTLLLRGVNVGGITKLPASPDGATHLNNSDGFWERPREVVWGWRACRARGCVSLGRVRARSWGWVLSRFLLFFLACVLRRARATPGVVRGPAVSAR